MKKILLYLPYVLLVLTSCSNVEDDFYLSISEDELECSPEGGEMVIGISSNSIWDCDYSDDWLFVRQQQDKIRVIVESNPTGEQRFGSIRIIVDGIIRDEIIVKQIGVKLEVDNDLLSANSCGDSFGVPVKSNAQWTYDCKIGWCSVDRVEDNLLITVDRNYKMADRNGTITLNAGDVSLNLALSQSGCQWFESFEMVEVEGGTFYMGAQNDNSNETNYDASAYQIESPVHQVSVSSFSMGIFEVTQAQWTAAMGSNPSENKGENLPVENVTWEQVQEFIGVLNEETGLNYRLPTEAEWEFAAKGGTASNGFSYSGSPTLNACGWYYSNSEATTHEVGSKIPNEIGIYDMSGNVREWCSDWFEYYSFASVENPYGAYSGSQKVNRGGSWTTPAINCRNSYRHTNYAYESFHDLGFRLVLPGQ